MSDIPISLLGCRPCGRRRIRESDLRDYSGCFSVEFATGSLSPWRSRTEYGFSGFKRAPCLSPPKAGEFARAGKTVRREGSRAAMKRKGRAGSIVRPNSKAVAREIPSSLKKNRPLLSTNHPSKKRLKTANPVFQAALPSTTSQAGCKNPA